MKLCDYGCGREAKYHLVFKTTENKWCCEEDYKKCLGIRKKNSESSKNKPLTKKHKIKISNSLKGKNKLTIEQIQYRYKTFSKEEEMRYNPDEPKKKEIQVHCKYSKCEKSKENGDWFTPSRGQIKQRIECLEQSWGFGESNFYCSEECKQSCCLFNVKSDPNRLNRFEKYIKNVYKETYKTCKKYFDIIENVNLRGKEHGYALDHKYTIYDGFQNNIDHKIIGHLKNLQVITILENSKKGRNSSITLEELLNQIKGYSTNKSY